MDSVGTVNEAIKFPTYEVERTREDNHHMARKGRHPEADGIVAAVCRSKGFESHISVEKKSYSERKSVFIIIYKTDYTILDSTRNLPFPECV